MGKQKRKRKKNQSKTKTHQESKPATDDKISPIITRRQMQIAVIVLGALIVVGYAAFGAVYGHNKIEAIWFLFLPVTVMLVIASCLQWQLLVTPSSTAPDEATNETTTSGLLVPADEPTPPNPCGNIPTDALLVLLGNSGSWGTRFPQTIIMINDEPMLTMDQIAGRIAISGKFFSKDGRIVAELRNNEFSINPNNYFRKKRPDTHSLIVWDQQNVEVLNVRFINPHTIKFLGVIRTPKTEIVISGKSGLFANTICTGEAGKAHFGFNVK
jgi:hypothetical protein